MTEKDEKSGKDDVNCAFLFLCGCGVFVVVGQERE